MRCNDCQLLLEEFFDGELNSQTGLQVRRHLDSCASCSSVLKNLGAEQAVYAGYKSDVEITPQLWAGVYQRITAEESPSTAPAIRRLQAWLGNAFALPRVSGPVAVALVVLAVALTVLVMRYVSGTAGDRPQLSVNGGSPQATPLPREERALVAPDETAKTPPVSREGKKDNGTKGVKLAAAANNIRTASGSRQSIRKTNDSSQLVREAEQKYLAAIAMLSRTVDRKRSRLDPATMAELEQALASIDRTIAATRRVVRRHPDDPLAAQYMLTAYARKVDVLREMVDY